MHNCVAQYSLRLRRCRLVASLKVMHIGRRLESIVVKASIFTVLQIYF